MTSSARQTARRLYADGLRDGTISTLRHLLAHPEAENPDGAYRGPLPNELREWAEAALARAESYR